jgi:hypothetical protein
MDMTSRIERLRDTVLKRVAASAHQGDIAGVARWSKLAVECDVVLRESQSLEKKVETLAKSIEGNVEIKNVASFPEEHTEDSISSDVLSAKTLGSKIRAEWVEELRTERKITITGYGKRYRTVNNESVGIAFANELSKIPDRWFLGMPDEPIDITVFLCRSSNDITYDFIIPVADLGSDWELLSRSGRQVKFNVRREGEHFYLLIPRSEPFPIDKYLGNVEPLCKQ